MSVRTSPRTLVAGLLAAPLLALALTACGSVPGVSAGDARAALDDALRLVDEAIALSPDIPGGAELKQALSASRDALVNGDGTLGMSRGTLETACALVSMGG